MQAFICNSDNTQRGLIFQRFSVFKQTNIQQYGFDNDDRNEKIKKIYFKENFKKEQS